MRRRSSPFGRRAPAVARRRLARSVVAHGASLLRARHGRLVARRAPREVARARVIGGRTSVPRSSRYRRPAQRAAVRERAARVERAARRQADEARRLTRDRLAASSSSIVEPGRLSMSPIVYGCRGIWKIVCTSRDLDDRPPYMTTTRSQSSATSPRSCVIRIVAACVSRLRGLEHLEDLRLDRHVERGRRLVGDQHASGCSPSPSRSSPAGACRPRTRAGTGRSAARGSGRRRGRAARSSASRAASSFMLGIVRRERLVDLVADREHRVQRRHRVLEDHRDLAAAELAELAASASSSGLLPLYSASPLDDPARRHGNQAEDRRAWRRSCRSPTRRRCRASRRDRRRRSRRRRREPRRPRSGTRR